MAEGFQAFSDMLADAAEQVGQSVVRVEARRRIPASGIVWAADGVIVTANHVVQREEEIRVGLPGGDTVAAALAGRDPATDLAVLRVEASGLAAANWAEAADLRPGQLALALGRPGSSLQAALGVVSAVEPLLGRRRGFGSGRIQHYVRPDVVMYPGFSGGPLALAGGQAAGMNTSALAPSGGVTIPAATLRAVVEMLLAHGRLRRGYLGISSQPVRLPDALGDELEQHTGLLIVSVEPGSPADQGGLLLGDTIVTVDGVPTETHDDLLGLLSGERIGERVAVRVVRGGAVQDLVVEIGERS